MTDFIPVKRALISVSDKTDIVALARRLASSGTQIISTGGTAGVLVKAGIDVTPVDQVTGFPEMMDGRVKTLHPHIHGGLLALRDEPQHNDAMAQHGIEPIDLVCVNLYPFEQTVARDGVEPEEAIEQIDIGGPSMIRSAAKNHRFVTVVTDPSQYDRVCNDLDANNGATTLALRTRLAAEAFARTAAYDAAIGAWMNAYAMRKSDGSELFPQMMVLRLNRLASLRYGENPHQGAALYGMTGSTEAGVANAAQLHGKQLSFNNLNDAAAALELVKEFAHPAAAVIKHTNPCGCAVGPTLAQAFEKAYTGDPLAAFGGIVALNRRVDQATAEAITGPAPDSAGGGVKFLEVILAPDYEPDALEILRQRWKNVRLLAVGELPAPSHRDTRQLDLKSIVGGILAQQRDLADMSPKSWQHVAGPPPGADLESSLRVAWGAVKHVKSNAIVLARDGAIVGVGAGQMDRVESCKIAVAKANVRDQHRSQGAVAASDAFFPFRDGPDVLIQAGACAIIQPGGSKRDDETITACNDAGITLLFTGRRHFRH